MGILSDVAYFLGYGVMIVSSLCFLLFVIGIGALLIWAYRNGKIRRTSDGSYVIDVERVKFRYPTEKKK